MSDPSDLPENIRFGDIRPSPTDKGYDQFDILIDGKVVHTMNIDMSRCMGSMHEYALHMEAEWAARQWLLERHLLPAKPLAA